MTLLELGRSQLCPAGDFHRLCAYAVLGKYFFGEQITWQRWLGTLLSWSGIVLVGLTAANTTGPGAEIAMRWLMVAIIVGSTVLADLLQSFEMKRQLSPWKTCVPDARRACWPAWRGAAL